MIDDKLKSTRKLLTFTLLLNSIAWFIPDVLFPDSHFQSSVWPLHARLHTGAAATINFIYILFGLWIIWKVKNNLKINMKWISGGLGLWNISAILFFMLVLPFIMGPNDTYISWSTHPEGAGNEFGTGIEGWVFLMAGLPALLFGIVFWRLRE